jgi:hypothetical protein
MKKVDLLPIFTTNNFHTLLTAELILTDEEKNSMFSQLKVKITDEKWFWKKGVVDSTKHTPFDQQNSNIFLHTKP